MSKKQAFMSTAMLVILAGSVIFLMGWKFYTVYGVLGTAALWLSDFKFMKVRVCEVWLTANPGRSFASWQETSKIGFSYYLISSLMLTVLWPSAFVSYLLWRKAIINEIEQ